MAVAMDYSTFVKKYYKFAKETADVVIASSVLTNGPINKHLDVALVKDLGVLSALDKAYYSYDPSKAVTKNGKAKFETFLATVIRNCVITELGKEGTRAGRANLVKLGSKPKPKKNDKSKPDARTDERRYGSAVIPNVRGNGDDGRILEPHEYMSYFAETKARQKEKLRRMLISKIQMLPESDKVLVMLFYQDPANYIDNYIEYFGLENASREAIQVKKRKALDKMKALLGGKRPDYKDFYVSSRDSYELSQDANAMSLSASDGMLGYNEMRRRRSAVSADTSVDCLAVADDIIRYHESLMM